MSKDNEENNLDIFFKMIDSVEGDILEILERESNELGRYECLVICFNYLWLYCEKIGIVFSRIEENYSAFKESNMDGALCGFDIDTKLVSSNEIEEFIGLLEEVEKGLDTFERRCKKTEESFDEWSCVFFMYNYLRKYCDETKTNYEELMSDILKIQSNNEKNGDASDEVIT